MMDYPYQVTVDLAGHVFLLQLHFKEACELFEPYQVHCQNNCTEVCLEEEDWRLLKKHGFQVCGQVEASYLAGYCSDHLLKHDCCVVHAVAFRDKDHAWIIAAGSGVGKSTQIKTLRELYPDTYEVICGDRPVLELCKDGAVMVYPAPWNGKEGWRGAEKAPLKGIICLSRGEIDSIRKMKRKEAVIPVFHSLIQTAQTEENLLRSGEFLSELLKRVPVYDFVNKDIPGSTRLLHDEVLMKEGL